MCFSIAQSSFGQKKIIIEYFHYNRKSISKQLYELRHEKTGFCVYENKGENNLCRYHPADQNLSIHFSKNTISPLPKSKMSSLVSSSVVVQTGLKLTRSKALNRVSCDACQIFVNCSIFCGISLDPPYARSPDKII